ncbi:Uncharacterised protein [uncultured archaeon]|nr:Uncharacterised protein [uncultured archaeon]
MLKAPDETTHERIEALKGIVNAVNSGLQGSISETVHDMEQRYRLRNRPHEM